MFLYLWMLPQNLIGLLTLLLYRKSKKFVEVFNECSIYSIESKFLSGGSLGKYIILNSLYFNNKVEYQKTIRHEYGHFLQGKIFGIFYLLIIGIPSLLNNLMSRVSEKIYKEYYTRYPEKWADKLGGVVR